MLGLKPEPLLPWDGVLLVVDRLLEDPFDFSTELGIYRLIFDMQLAQCCMPIPRTQKGKPTVASQPWPASADLNDREQILACFMGVQDANEILGYLRDIVSMITCLFFARWCSRCTYKMDIVSMSFFVVACLCS